MSISRIKTMKDLTNVEKIEGLDVAQKIKVKWGVEGDKNSKNISLYFTKKERNL